MNESLEQIKGYLNAFEAINDGNYEGTDYLMRRCNSNKKLESLSFERINNWQESLDIIFENYFTRNAQLMTNLYKIKFIEMLNKYINNEQFEVLGSGINYCYSSIAEYFGEVSGSDIIFIFNKKILIIHFGIND